MTVEEQLQEIEQWQADAGIRPDIRIALGGGRWHVHIATGHDQPRIRTDDPSLAAALEAARKQMAGVRAPAA